MHASVKNKDGVGKMKCSVQVQKKELKAEQGENLLEVLRKENMAPEAPCGGNGKCGKCKVTVNGEEKLACQTIIEKDMIVQIGVESEDTNILSDGWNTQIEIDPVREGYLLAFDIGTTTVVGYLLDKNGKELATSSMLNPQSPYGADVISRIRLALKGDMEALTEKIRKGLATITEDMCSRAKIVPDEIAVVSVVGNPCMQQLFLGIIPENLATVPFTPVIIKTEISKAKDILPLWNHAVLLTVPDISGYVGADTMACVLSTHLYEQDAVMLMVDIGTNGEMVLGNCERMVACSTAAGPALEGVQIHFGMRGAKGAIDHVWSEEGRICCSVIGDTEAVGICGSGLIDAVAVLLDLGKINKRGRIQDTKEVDGQRVIYLTDQVYLTQNDIREVQMAKGAIAAGICLLADYLDIAVDDIEHVLLAGAFGSFMNAKSACKIGLLPKVLSDRIETVGNASGNGAKMLACNRKELEKTDQLVSQIQFLELAQHPDFQKTFAKCMGL